MNPEIAKIYGNKVRIRVCGLCWEEDSLLMVKHRFGDQDFWAPPGGGVEFGESIESALKREFLEETGLHILPKKFLFVCEFLKNPLHAIELFFEVAKVSGTISDGYDPEIQLIEKVRFLRQKEIEDIPDESLHGILKKFEDLNALRQLNGFYRI
jgi:8-oxo-dGTP diphosphatase